MSDLQPFAKDPACAKCACMDIYVRFVAQGESYEAGGWFTGKPLIPHKEVDRLSCLCRRCGWRWVSECAPASPNPRLCAYCGKPTGMEIVWALGEACCGSICAHAVVSRYWAACAAGASLRPADDVAPDGPAEWALKAHAMRRAAKKVLTGGRIIGAASMSVDAGFAWGLKDAVRDYDAVCPDPESAS